MLSHYIIHVESANYNPFIIPYIRGSILPLLKSRIFLKLFCIHYHILPYTRIKKNTKLFKG